jgi:glycosyltransferase involved in cell wall biosynthesis
VNIIAHDYFLDCPNGGYFNFKKNRICRLKPMSLSCALTNCDRISYARKLIRLVRSFIQLKILSKLVFNIRYVSEFQKTKIVKAQHLAKHTSVLPNIIYDVSKRVSNVERESAPTDFVFIGRFEKEKGIVQLLDALSLSGTTCAFIGDGTLKGLIKSCDKAVVSEKWLEKTQVQEFLSKSKAIIIPSLWYEADPLTSIEAASLSVPRVVSIHCSAANDVCNMEDGIVIDPYNVFSFAATLKNIVDGKIDMVTIASNATRIFNAQMADRKKLNKEFEW